MTGTQVGVNSKAETSCLKVAPWTSRRPLVLKMMKSVHPENCVLSSPSLAEWRSTLLIKNGEGPTERKICETNGVRKIRTMSKWLSHEFGSLSIRTLHHLSLFSGAHAASKLFEYRERTVPRLLSPANRPMGIARSHVSYCQKSSSRRITTEGWWEIIITGQ